MATKRWRNFVFEIDSFMICHLNESQIINILRKFLTEVSEDSCPKAVELFKTFFSHNAIGKPINRNRKHFWELRMFHKLFSNSNLPHHTRFTNLAMASNASSILRLLSHIKSPIDGSNCQNSIDDKVYFLTGGTVFTCLAKHCSYRKPKADAES